MLSLVALYVGFQGPKIIFFRNEDIYLLDNYFVTVTARLADKGMFQNLVQMLSSTGGPAQEAAYAIWNLTVGHQQNSAAIARLGAVPKLAELLKSTSDIAQENAAGAGNPIRESPFDS